MCSIPQDVDDTEYVMRTIFSPANLNAKGGLRPNYMRPQFSKQDEDDSSIASNKLSVTRYNYVGIEFCRDHAKKNSSMPNRMYWGFARFLTKDIRKCEVDVVSKPTRNNFAHANIVYPFQIQVQINNGVPLDPEIELKIKQLLKESTILQDPDPYSKEWTGKDPLK